MAFRFVFGAVVLLSACTPRPASPEPTGDTPTLELLSACTTYDSCVHAHERARAFSERCGGCAEGRDTVISVRAKLDSLYIEEQRKAYERSRRR